MEEFANFADRIVKMEEISCFHKRVWSIFRGNSALRAICSQALYAFQYSNGNWKVSEGDSGRSLRSRILPCTWICEELLPLCWALLIRIYNFYSPSVFIGLLTWSVLNFNASLLKPNAYKLPNNFQVEYFHFKAIIGDASFGGIIGKCKYEALQYSKLSLQNNQQYFCYLRGY
ncbi:hypothetical protein BDF20DRAFT_836474 [Mycotypha africana]|uniref:uncharacterized protein n=1 Tax=Mycotypha africana TaxID=64632 RepID=UPI0023006243|nr:uncharacterized protein BDF20DRAFT_836474 [Mycotypha africana]KAI8975034.1 hypothetical protein BDF20DRAFT_836474 [Mycotypha africana]